MKNRILSIVALLSLVVSCNDIKELTDRVDNLETRVEALETLCETMNGQVVALQTFVSNNKSISKVEKATDGTYTLTLSDNSTIVLKQGSEGTAVMPEIAINNDGNWTVDGEVLKVNGQPVPATGANGATPIFGVDADGYWTVKYAADETPARILDAAGNPVKATADGFASTEAQDSFFSSVAVEGEKVVVTLKADGKSYSLPVIPDFVCSIEAPAQPIVFDAGATKSFNVTQKNVVAATLFCPAGWNASLSDNLLTVTAPAAVKSVSADTRQDVGILAISNNGFAAIAKIMVQLSDTPIVVVPTAALSAGEATQTSLSFTVTLSNASKWYYILQKSDAEAPTAEALKAATEGTETTLTLTKDASGADLVHSTSYTLYVLPVNDTADGSIASVALATAEKVYTSMYERFMDTGSITVGGKVYNKSDYTDDQIVQVTDAAEFTAENGKIYFVAAASSIKGLPNNNVIIIGEDSSKKPVYTPTASRLLSAVKDQTTRMVLYNVNINSAALANYTFGVDQSYADKGAFGELVVDNCDVTMDAKPFFAITSTGRYLDRFVMQNCKVSITSGDANKFILNPAGQENVFSEVIFKNNVFYCPSGLTAKFRLISSPTNENNKTTVKNLTVQNNTFVNIAPSNTAMIVMKDNSMTDIQKNIIYIDQTLTAGGSYITYYGAYPAIGNRACRDNIYYNTNGKNFNMFAAAGNISDYVQTTEQTTKVDASPFSSMDYATATFVPATDYASYGVQR